MLLGCAAVAHCIRLVARDDAAAENIAIDIAIAFASSSARSLVHWAHRKSSCHSLGSPP
jgi:hypothetical protein